MIEKEYVHEFVSITGHKSRCHIRILNKPDTPLVVICSQMANRPGTSITNSAEQIAFSTQKMLAQEKVDISSRIVDYLKNTKVTNILDKTIKYLKENDKKMVFILASIKLALDNFQTYCRDKDKVENMIWVEHYNADMNFTNKDEYIEVTFDKKSWEPHWEGTSIERLSAKTGYKADEFVIPTEIIQQV